MFRILCLLVSGFWLAGCASYLSVEERRLQAETLLNAAGFASVPEVSIGQPVAAWLKGRGASLEVWIEGDGFAWVNGRRQSVNPTPLDPLALRMAIAEPANAVAYLARHCQYLNCDDLQRFQSLWDEARFSPKVVADMGRALDRLKKRSGANTLVLNGYSGGGALAVLLAASRSDVTRVVTVAGNLDTRRFAKDNRLPPLQRSLNPLNAFPKLKPPVTVLSGIRDDVIRLASVEATVLEMGKHVSVCLRRMENDHYDWQAPAVMAAKDACFQGN